MNDTPKSGHRRFRWLLPLLLAVGWLALSSWDGQFGNRLGEVVKNDNAAFLPASAEATKVSNLEGAFYGDEQIPAVVIWTRDRGITGADLAAAKADTTWFGTLPGVKGQAAGPIPSRDGKALEVIVPLRTTGDAALLPDAVKKIRDRAGNHPGLSSHVTGPGGSAADFSVVFAGVDVKLLLVALGAVLIILLIVYRSIVLPLAVLTSAVFSQGIAAAAVYYLARDDVIKLSGQSQGTLIIICVGAATDYALLLVGRYREELARQDSKYAAMGTALRRTTPAILASGGTVIVAMLCLLLADLNSNRGYGPVFAVAIGSAVLSTLTFLAAVLTLLGRAAFWPARPRYGSARTQIRGVWVRISAMIARRPRRVWVGATIVLLGLVAFLPTFRVTTISSSDSFLSKPDSVQGSDVLAEHFPAGSGAPALIVVPAAKEQALTTVVKAVHGIADVAAVGADPSGAGSSAGKAKVVGGRVLLQATLTDPSDSGAARQTVDRLRTAVHHADAGSLVGGTTAIAVDTSRAGVADLKKITPIVLVVVLLLLMLLLRAFVAPLLLIATTVLSVAATFGLAAIAFNHVFRFPGADPSLPLFCVVFLIALGVDYNIFLMTRVREESHQQGDTRRGIVRGLTTTGGVITSAGVVLAATFSVLGIIPLLALAEIAFIVVAGVLIDTFVVRALLVPALSYDAGRRIWWPGRHGRGKGVPPAPAQRRPAGQMSRTR